MRHTTFVSISKLGFYFLIPLCFIFVPTSFLDAGPTICLIKNLFGIECPGCGMTRAISSIFHGEIVRAFQYNRLVVIVFPLLSYVHIKNILGECRRLKVTI